MIQFIVNDGHWWWFMISMMASATNSSWSRWRLMVTHLISTGWLWSSFNQSHRFLVLSGADAAAETADAQRAISDITRKENQLLSMLKEIIATFMQLAFGVASCMTLAASIRNAVWTSFVYCWLYLCDFAIVNHKLLTILNHYIPLLTSSTVWSPVVLTIINHQSEPATARLVAVGLTISHIPASSTTTTMDA